MPLIPSQQLKNVFLFFSSKFVPLEPCTIEHAHMALPASFNNERQ